jgi:hypothetical protein
MPVNLSIEQLLKDAIDEFKHHGHIPPYEMMAHPELAPLVLDILDTYEEEIYLITADNVAPDHFYIYQPGSIDKSDLVNLQVIRCQSI